MSQTPEGFIGPEQLLAERNRLLDQMIDASATLGAVARGAGQEQALSQLRDFQAQREGKIDHSWAIDLLAYENLLGAAGKRQAV